MTRMMTSVPVRRPIPSHSPSRGYSHGHRDLASGAAGSHWNETIPARGPGRLSDSESPEAQAEVAPWQCRQCRGPAAGPGPGTAVTVTVTVLPWHTT